MGKTKDYVILDRILDKELIMKQVLSKCGKTRSSCQCKNEGKCFKRFGDALDTVSFVEEVR